MTIFIVELKEDNDESRFVGCGITPERWQRQRQRRTEIPEAEVHELGVRVWG